MKKHLNTTIAIIALFIISIILIYQINTKPEPPCCDKIPVEENCNVMDVPDANADGRIDSEKVMTYYKLDDNCNFQTLVFNGYDSPGYTILGRFTGEVLPNNRYKIERLEVKIFELDKRESFDEKKYKITNVKLREKTKPEEGVAFIITIAEDNKPTPSKEVDYIYGIHSGENAINLSTSANMSFEVEVSGNHGRVGNFATGGYECDGVAIVSGG